MARILYFTRDYTTHDHRFLASLAHTQHQVFYLRLEKRGHVLEDRPVPHQVEQVIWAGGQKPFSMVDAPRFVSSLRQVIRVVEPDLIQAGPLQTAAFLVALVGFHPLVSMSWGYDLLHDADRNAFWKWATRFTLQRSDWMVGDCQTIRRKAVSLGMAPGQIVTFPWGVDIHQFAPRSLEDGTRQHERISSQNGEREAFVLFSTRAWEPVYGVDVLAQAFVLAAQQRPELYLVMLGNGSLAEQLRTIFLKGGVAERVSFPGQVSQKDLPRYYCRAHLYVSASRSDGTSISLLEAMACGLPVLLSDIPGNLEWLEPGVNGWSFRDGDPRALSEAILKAVEQREQLVEMGRAAREIAVKRADWTKNFKILLEAYNQVLAT